MNLREGLAAFALPPHLETPLSTYLDELIKWNAAYNLTAVRDRDEMIVRHLLDSLVILPHVRSPLLDVGTGAGLPAIPLAIANPSVNITALDSNGKKTRFLRHAKRVLKLENLSIAEARVEAFAPPAPFAAIVSRAFASLDEFVSLTRHLLQPQGRWLAMKGKLDDAELKALSADIAVVEVVPLLVPGLMEARHLIILTPQ